MRFEDKVAVVTGASRGIGRAIALALGAEGARVVVNYRSQAAAADEVVSAILAAGGEAISFQADVSRHDQAQALIKRAQEAFDGIHILVNNAGGTGPRAALATSERYFEAALRFNVTQAFLLTRMVVPHMVETAGGGAIVNISSRSSDMVQTSFVAYAAGKAALRSMTETMAAEFGPKGVRVNAVAPGYVLTPAMAARIDAGKRDTKAIVDQSALRRFVETHEVAQAIYFLCSDAASAITGVTIPVDCGWLAYSGYAAYASQPE